MTVLSDNGDMPNLPPIEDYLHELATARELPDGAVAICTLRLPESGPALRAVLARAADGEALTEDEATLLFRGLFILGGRRDPQAFAPIVDRRIDEFVREALLGAATFLAWEGRIERETMARFLERFYEERLAAD